MRTFMILNAKGGCGKSTIATNLASYFASNGQTVVLADLDPQQSSMDWLNARDPNRPEIIGINGLTEKLKVSKKTDVVIFDVPAVTHGKELTAAIRKADTIILPVLPSPMDIRAASRFIKEISSVNRIEKKEAKIAVIANRVRENTVVYHKLAVFLKSLKVPFIGTLRDTQNYIRAAERGLGVFEMAPSAVNHDLEQWESIIKWIKSKRSMP